MRASIDLASRTRRIAACLAAAAGLTAWPQPAGAQQPPPPYAPAPPPYYAPQPQYAPPPPPYYAPPPPYYAPPPPPAAGPQPVVYDVDPDDPVPTGYARTSRANTRLIGIGIGLLSASWLTSILVGSVASQAAGDAPSSSPDQVTGRDWIPMFIPVAGPFMALGTLRPRAAGTGFLIMDGVFQTGGVLGIVIGALDRRYKLVRSDTGRSVEIVPSVGLGFSGLQATGRF